MIEITDKSKCCGCKACGDCCPVDAISFPIDKEGFWYPEIDQSKCVGCNRCEQVCPMLHPEKTSVTKKEDLKVYGGYHKDIVVRFDSTSGGVFSALAQEMYSRKGYVSGAIYTDDFQVVNFISDKKRDLRKLRSSKYVQSDGAGLYKQIAALLKEGKEVLACGSPCQMAALRSYLGRDYDNLLIVDFLCRACNSPKVFQHYLADLEDRYQSKIVAIKDKNKDHGWRSLARKITFADGQIYYGEGHDDDYRRGYHLNIFERPSCYECQFKGMPRKSDITLADFWGIEKVDPSLDKDVGTSMVFVNTSKGHKFFAHVQERMHLKEFPFEVAEKGNHSVIFGGTLPVPAGYDREKFFTDLDEMSFSQCAAKHFPMEPVHKSWKQLVKKILRFGYHWAKNPQRYLRSFLYSLCHGNIHDSWSKGHFLNLYSHCALDISRKAQMHIDGHVALGTKRNRRSKAETALLLDDDAKLVIKGNSYISSGADIQIHRGGKLVIGSCAINKGFQLVCQERIELGDDVHIGRDVWIRDNNGGHIIVVKGSRNSAPVIIGDHVWICSNVSITKGVTIGKGAIVSANSVVSSNVPAHTIVAGNPAKVIAENVIWRP